MNQKRESCFKGSKIHQNGPTDMTITPQGTKLYVLGNKNYLYCKNLVTKEKQSIFLNPKTQKYYAIATHPIQTGSIVVGGTQGKVYSLNFMNQIQPQIVYEADTSIQCLKFSHNGKFLGIGLEKGCNLYFWQKQKTVKFSSQHDDRIYSIVFSPNNKLICTFSFSFVFKIHNINQQTNSLKLLLTHNFVKPGSNINNPHRFQISINNQSNIIAIPGHFILREVKVQQRSAKIHLNKPITHNQNIIQNCHFFNSERLITVGVEKILKIWNYNKPQLLVIIQNIFFGRMINLKQTFMGIDSLGTIYQFLKINYLKSNDKKYSEQFERIQQKSQKKQIKTPQKNQLQIEINVEKPFENKNNKANTIISLDHQTNVEKPFEDKNNIANTIISLDRQENKLQIKNTIVIDENKLDIINVQNPNNQSVIIIQKNNYNYNDESEKLQNKKKQQIIVVQSSVINIIEEQKEEIAIQQTKQLQNIINQINHINQMQIEPQEISKKQAIIIQQQKPIQQKNTINLQQQKNKNLEIQVCAPQITTNFKKAQKNYQISKSINNSIKKDLQHKNQRIINPQISKRFHKWIKTDYQSALNQLLPHQISQTHVLIYCNQYGFITSQNNQSAEIKFQNQLNQRRFEVNNYKSYKHFCLNNDHSAYSNNQQLGIIGKYFNWTINFSANQIQSNIEENRINIIINMTLGKNWISLNNNNNQILIYSTLDAIQKLKISEKPEKKYYLGLQGYQNLLLVVYEKHQNLCNNLFMDIYMIFDQNQIYENEQTVKQWKIKKFIFQEMVPISLGAKLVKIGFSKEAMIYSIDSVGKFKFFSFQSKTWSNLSISIQQKQINLSQSYIIGVKNYTLFLVNKNIQVQSINNFYPLNNLLKIQLKLSNEQSMFSYKKSDKVITFQQILWKRYIQDHEKFRFTVWGFLKQQRNQSNLNYSLTKDIYNKQTLQMKLLASDSRFANLIQNLVQKNDSNHSFQFAKRFIKTKLIQQKMVNLFQKVNLKNMSIKLQTIYRDLLKIKQAQLRKNTVLQKQYNRKQLFVDLKKIIQTKMTEKINQQARNQKFAKNITQKVAQIKQNAKQKKSILANNQMNDKMEEEQKKQTFFDKMFREMEKQKIQIKNGIRTYKQKPNEFINSIKFHYDKFKDFHQKKLNQLKNMIRHSKFKIQQNKKKTQEQQYTKQASQKLKIMKQQDMNQYLKYIQQTKNKKIQQLIHQTNRFMKELGLKILKSQNDFTVQQSLQNVSKIYQLITKSIPQKIQSQPKNLVGGTLKSYQLTGLQWLVSLYNNNLNGILADQMGLGKTIQVIALIAYLIQNKNNKGPFLIVVPLSTVDNWVKQFSTWIPSVILVTMKGEKNNRARAFRTILSSKFNVCITTYDYIIIESNRLTAIEWEYIIVDEGQKLKSKGSKFRNMLIRQYQSKHRLILSGTPLQNNIQQLWSLLNFLLPSVFNSALQFTNWFKVPIEQQNENQDNVQLRQQQALLIIDRFHRLLRLFLLRRLKKEVQLQIPDKKQQILKVQLSGLQKILYQQMTNRKQNGNPDHFMKTTASMRKLVNHPLLLIPNYQTLLGKNDFIISTSGKFQLLDRILPKLLKFRHRILIFTQMTTTLDILQYYLEYRGLLYLRLDGRLRVEKRNLILHQFNNPNTNIDILIISTKSGSGINLQTADTVIIFDSDYNPQMDIQAQDRAHRLGQTREVLVLRFVTNTWIQLDILQRAEQKKKIDIMLIHSNDYNSSLNSTQKLKRIQRTLREKNFPTYERNQEISNDQLINKVIARTSQQFDLFNQIDQIRYLRDNMQIKQFQEIKQGISIQNYNKTVNYRLISQDDIPQQLLQKYKEIFSSNFNKSVSQSQEDFINQINNQCKDKSINTNKQFKEKQIINNNSMANTIQRIFNRKHPNQKTSSSKQKILKSEQSHQTIKVIDKQKQSQQKSMQKLIANIRKNQQQNQLRQKNNHIAKNPQKQIQIKKIKHQKKNINIIQKNEDSEQSLNEQQEEGIISDQSKQSYSPKPKKKQKLENNNNKDLIFQKSIKNNNKLQDNNQNNEMLIKNKGLNTDKYSTQQIKQKREQNIKNQTNNAFKQPKSSLELLREKIKQKNKVIILQNIQASNAQNNSSKNKSKTMVQIKAQPIFYEDEKKQLQIKKKQLQIKKVPIKQQNIKLQNQQSLTSKLGANNPLKNLLLQKIKGITRNTNQIQSDLKERQVKLSQSEQQVSQQKKNKQKKITKRRIVIDRKSKNRSYISNLKVQKHKLKLVQSSQEKSENKSKQQSENIYKKFSVIEKPQNRLRKRLKKQNEINKQDQMRQQPKKKEIQKFIQQSSQITSIKNSKQSQTKQQIVQNQIQNMEIDEQLSQDQEQLEGQQQIQDSADCKKYKSKILQYKQQKKKLKIKKLKKLNMKKNNRLKKSKENILKKLITEKDQKDQKDRKQIKTQIQQVDMQEVKKVDTSQQMIQSNNKSNEGVEIKQVKEVDKEFKEANEDGEFKEVKENKEIKQISQIKEIKKAKQQQDYIAKPEKIQTKKNITKKNILKKVSQIKEQQKSINENNQQQLQPQNKDNITQNQDNQIKQTTQKQQNTTLFMRIEGLKKSGVEVRQNLKLKVKQQYQISQTQNTKYSKYLDKIELIRENLNGNNSKIKKQIQNSKISIQQHPINLYQRLKQFNYSNVVKSQEGKADNKPVAYYNKDTIDPEKLLHQNYYQINETQQSAQSYLLQENNVLSFEYQTLKAKMKDSEKKTEKIIAQKVNQQIEKQKNYWKVKKSIGSKRGKQTNNKRRKKNDKSKSKRRPKSSSEQFSQSQKQQQSQQQEFIVRKRNNFGRQKDKGKKRVLKKQSKVKQREQQSNSGSQNEENKMSDEQN